MVGQEGDGVYHEVLGGRQRPLQRAVAHQPFTHKNGAVVNLGEFLREHMNYHAEQEWHDVDDSEQDVPVYLEKRAVAVRKKEFQSTRAMLAQKRRRVEPDAAPLQ